MYKQQHLRVKPQPIISVKSGEIKLKTLRDAIGFGLIHHIDICDYSAGDDYEHFREQLRLTEGFEQTELRYDSYKRGNLSEYYEQLANLFTEQGNTHMSLKCEVKALLIAYRGVLWRERIPQSRYIFLRQGLLHHGYTHEAARLDAYHQRMVSHTW